MNRLKFLLAAFVVALVTLGLYSCAKDEVINSQNNILESRTLGHEINTSGLVTNSQGILAFSSFAAFDTIYNELKVKSNNGTYANAAYNQLGLDTTSDVFITEDPVNKLFEQTLNFSSFRNTEEQAYESFVTAGNEPIDFDKNNLLADDNFKTLVNSNGEIKIGKKYFKIYNDGTCLVVGNNDLNTFNNLKGLSTDHISTSYGVRVLDFENGDKTYLFDVTESGQRSDKDIIDLKIGFTQNILDQTVPTNQSFVDLIGNSQVSYKWEFSDGTIFYGVHPNKVLQDVDTINLSVIKDGIEIEDIDIIWHRHGVICNNNIRVTQKSGCNFDVFIEIAWNNNVGGKVEWKLPNHTIMTGTNTPAGNLLNITAVGNPFFVSAILYDKDGRYICHKSVELICNSCGITGNKRDDSFPVNISGKIWKANVEIWCRNNLFVTSIGSETKSMRKSLSGIFLKRNCNELYASFQGIIQDGTQPLCPDIVVPFSDETELDGGLLQRNVNPPTKDPNYLKNQNRCESTHWFRVGSTTVTYTKNSGKLFLN